MTKKTELDVVKTESRIEWNKDMNNAKENTMNTNTELTAEQKAMIDAAAIEAPVVEPTTTNPAVENIVAGFDIKSEEAKFVIENNRVSLLPAGCNRVEVIRDYFSCRSALTAFLDLYREQKYRIVTPELFIYSFVNGLDTFSSKKVGYISAKYANDADAVMFPDGSISELRFHRIPKIGWAEVWNYNGILGVDHKELVPDSQFEVNRDEFRKCSFIHNYVLGCGYVFTFGPALSNYIAQIYKTWNMSTEEARKESSQRWQAKVERTRIFQVSRNMQEDLKKSETVVEETDLVVKAFPDGSELHLAGTLPGTRFQLYDCNGVRKFVLPWVAEKAANVCNVKAQPVSWLWEKLDSVSA
jgi:hypothetical protein